MNKTKKMTQKNTQLSPRQLAFRNWVRDYLEFAPQFGSFVGNVPDNTPALVNISEAHKSGHLYPCYFVYMTDNIVYMTDNNLFPVTRIQFQKELLSIAISQNLLLEKIQKGKGLYIRGTKLKPDLVNNHDCPCSPLEQSLEGSEAPLLDSAPLCSPSEQDKSQSKGESNQPRNYPLIVIPEVPTSPEIETALENADTPLLTEPVGVVLEQKTGLSGEKQETLLVESPAVKGKKKPVPKIPPVVKPAPKKRPKPVVAPVPQPKGEPENSSLEQFNPPSAS